MERGIGQEEAAGAGRTWQGADGGEGAAGAGREGAPGGQDRHSSAFPRARIYPRGDEDGPAGQQGAWGMSALRKASSAAEREQGTAQLGLSGQTSPSSHGPGIHVSSPEETSGKGGVCQGVN